jgi:uncharacterized membrane protein HdeD (DUF308 family)
VTAFGSARGFGAQVLSGILGLAYLAAGAACLLDVATGMLILALMVGLAWILSGVAELVFAFNLTGAWRTVLIVFGVVSTVFGGLLVMRPGVSLAVVVVMTGASGLIVGIGEILFALNLRRSAS